MKIGHIGLFVHDIELMRNFYESCFNGIPNNQYINHANSFRSYFISFEFGARLELMYLDNKKYGSGELLGLHHIGFELSSVNEVDKKTDDIKKYGLDIIIPPRITGLGDYVSTVKDPEGNIIELIASKNKYF